jgi:glycosyltransferase involved in cell wall biosynthesis
MRVVIASTNPLLQELGTGQVHLGLAAGLRELGHDVQLWSPAPLGPGHWTTAPWRLRGQWRAFLRAMGPVDAVDCPPLLASLRAGHRARWICRSTQPDILYSFETLRGESSAAPASLARQAVRVGWTGALAAAFYAGWMASDVSMCHTRAECRRIARSCPWVAARLTTWDGVLADGDRAALDEVRRSRWRRTAGPTRYLWIGRWTPHKGTRRLVDFLATRLVETQDEFTVAGCGEPGVAALARFADRPRLRVVPSFTRSELPALLAAHDAGLFTSEAEGWGLVLNEMIEAGLPVYATDVGGVEALRAVLPSSLPPFPPPRGATLPEPPSEDAYRRYRDRFSWKSVAARYAEVALSF